MFICGCPMFSSTPVELHIQIKNSTSTTIVIGSELKQETLPVGKTTDVIFWRTLAIICPKGYTREIDCFHNLPDDIVRKRSFNYLRLKENLTFFFELTDEGLLYLSHTGNKLYKKQYPICYDELLFIPTEFEENDFITLKIKNNGSIPIHLTEISSFPPSTDHSSCKFMLDEYFKPILLMPGAEHSISFPLKKVLSDLYFQIKTDSQQQPSLTCRIRKWYASGTNNH